MNHKDYLLQCIELAKKRLGFCAPNPAVGAVVVKDNQVISEGFHFGCGHPHAEVDALDKCGDAAAGATLYVSLEPCCHHGRTPPCTDRIKQAGIKAVYFGLQDPNPIVAGKGCAQLNEAGIVCEQLELPEVNLFYAPYIYWTQNKKPFVTAKLALSADHKIAGKNKEPVKISGKECELLTHQNRLHADAILTTINTIQNDNPSLNVRFDGESISKPIYILDSDCQLPLDRHIFQTSQSITVFCEKKSPHANKLEKKGVRCILVPKNEYGLDLSAVLKYIGEEGVHHLWVEAGAKCFDSFLKQDLLNRIIFYKSKNKLGDDALSAKIDFDLLTQHAVQYECGEDVVFDVLIRNH